MAFYLEDRNTHGRREQKTQERGKGTKTMETVPLSTEDLRNEDNLNRTREQYGQKRKTAEMAALALLMLTVEK